MGAVLAQGEVVFERAPFIAVAINEHVRPGVALHEGCDGHQDGLVAFQDVRLVEIEMDLMPLNGTAQPRGARSRLKWDCIFFLSLYYLNCKPNLFMVCFQDCDGWPPDPPHSVP